MKQYRHQPWAGQSNREHHYHSPDFEPNRGRDGFESGRQDWRGERDRWQAQSAGRDNDPYGPSRRQDDARLDRGSDPYQYDPWAGAPREAQSTGREWNDAGRERNSAGQWQSDYGPYADRERYPMQDRGNRHPGTVGDWQDTQGPQPSGQYASGYGYRNEGGWQRSMPSRFSGDERSRASSAGRNDSGYYDDDFRDERVSSRTGGGYGGYGSGIGGGMGGTSRSLAGWGGQERFDSGMAVRQGLGRSPKGYTRSDERIREDICERLMQDPQLDVGDVSVDVENGTVNLSGQVQQRWMKHRIEDVADGCGGVKDVRNQINVAGRQKPDSGEAGETVTRNRESGSDDSSTTASDTGGNGHSKRATMGGGN